MSFSGRSIENFKETFNQGKFEKQERQDLEAKVLTVREKEEQPEGYREVIEAKNDFYDRIAEKNPEIRDILPSLKVHEKIVQKWSNLLRNETDRKNLTGISMLESILYVSNTKEVNDRDNRQGNDEKNDTERRINTIDEFSQEKNERLHPSVS